MRDGISKVDDPRAAIPASTSSYHRTPDPIDRSSPQ
jgi:hypothetical protein